MGTLVDLLWLKQALRPMRCHDAFRWEWRQQRSVAVPSKAYLGRTHVETGGNWDK
jgi:hypothetical protein